MTEYGVGPIDPRHIEIRKIDPRHIEARTIEPDVIEVGDILEDLRAEEPWVVEAVILRALAEFSMGGPPMGKDEARRWLGLYRQHVIDAQEQNRGQ